MTVVDSEIWTALSDSLSHATHAANPAFAVRLGLGVGHGSCTVARGSRGLSVPLFRRSLTYSHTHTLSLSLSLSSFSLSLTRIGVCTLYSSTLYSLLSLSLSPSFPPSPSLSTFMPSITTCIQSALVDSPHPHPRRPLHQTRSRSASTCASRAAGGSRGGSGCTWPCRARLTWAGL